MANLMTYEDRCELEEMFMGFVTRNEEPTHEERIASWGEDQLVFDEDVAALTRIEERFSFTEADNFWNDRGRGGIENYRLRHPELRPTSIKFRVADGKCSTVKTLDTLEEAIEFCDKYYLPYGLIIRLENGVQVSDYGEYEWFKAADEHPIHPPPSSHAWTAPFLPLPPQPPPAEVAEQQRDCLQKGMDNVSKILGLPYKTVRLVKLRNRTVVMTLEK